MTRWAGSLALAGVLLLSPVARQACAGETTPPGLENLDPAVADAIRRQYQKVTRETNIDTLGTLCLIYAANVLWEPARECFEAAAELAPDDYLWAYYLAIATRESGLVEEAARRLLELARLHPDFAPLQQRLGEALLEAGQTAPAEAAYRRVIELLPTAPEGYAGLGESLLQQQQYAGAAESLEQSVRLDPAYRTAHYLLGLAYRGLGRREDALRELELGLDASPRYLPDPLSQRMSNFQVSSTARVEQAGMLLGMGRPEQASALLEQALAFDPDNHTLLNNLAVAYMQQGRLDQAYETLQRALAVDDGKFSTYLNLSAWATRSRQPEQALAFADAAVARADNLAETHLARARVLAQLGRHEEAVESLRTATRLNSRSPAPFTMFGEELTRLKRYEEAEQGFRDALSVDAGFFPAYLGLARVYITLGRLDEAAAALRRADELAPGHPAVAALSGQLEARR